MADEWEARYGLDLHSAAGSNGGGADNDGDGASNAQEFAANTHPNGEHQRYLAEGATGDFFDARIALVNASTTETAHAQLRFLRENNTVVTNNVLLPPRSRRTVFVDDVPGMAHASFSTVVDSDHPVVVNRTMTWGNGNAFGSHAETSVDGPATTWYFAEGATILAVRSVLSDSESEPDDRRRGDGVVPAVAGRGDRSFVHRAAERTSHHSRRRSPGPRGSGRGRGVHVDERRARDRRAGDVCVAARTAARGRPRQRGRDLARHALVPRRRRGWHVLRYVRADRQSQRRRAAIRVSYLLPSGEVIVRNHTVPKRAARRLAIEAEAIELQDQTASTIVESINGVPVVVERAMWWPGRTPTTGTKDTARSARRRPV